MLQKGEMWILWAVKWELSLAASKMGETWSDGGPPLLGLAQPAIGYCSAEITNGPPESVISSTKLSQAQLFATNISFASEERPLLSY